MIRKNLTILLLLVALSIPATYFLLIPGFFEPHDLHHLADIYQMAKALISGQLPPRLGPDFSFGYGYPLFNLYYVLPFYIGSVWYLIFGSLTASFKFVFLLSAILSVVGMYLFLKEFLGKLAATTGAFIFLYTPYRAVQIYVRGAMGEALALALLPLVLLAIVKLTKKTSNKTVVFSVLISSLFVLSHNYFFALALPFVFFLLITLYIEGKKRINLSGYLTAGVLTAGITLYWWLPALVEQKLVSSVTPFPLIDHFPFVKQLIMPGWGYGSSVWGPGDGLSFQIGIINILAVVASLVVLMFRKKIIKEKKIRLLFYWALASFFMSVFLMNIRSYPLWNLVPFYNFIQFPWRLLSFTTFFSAVLAAVIIHSIQLDKRFLTSVFLMLATITLTFKYFHPSKIVKVSDATYINYFFNDPTYSEDYLLLPKWSSIRPTAPPLSKIETEEGKIIEINKVSDIDWTARINLPDDSIVTFNEYYFPGWTAKIDDMYAEITTGIPYGQIEIDVPRGEHTLEFFWKETKFRKTADYISVISLIATLFLLGKKGKNIFAKFNV